jgi:hypothetical protein
MPRLAWTTEDDARLTEVWADPAPIKTQLDKFPGRTEPALSARARELELPDRRSMIAAARVAVTFEHVRLALATEPATREELASHAGVAVSTVRRFIKAHRAEVRILKYAPRGADGYAPAVWAWGAGDDAPRPKAKLPKENALAYYRRVRRDPFVKAKRAARARLKYERKTGRFPRRDAAALALFGPAAPDDDGGA